MPHFIPKWVWLSLLLLVLLEYFTNLLLKFYFKNYFRYCVMCNPELFYNNQVIKKTITLGFTIFVLWIMREWVNLLEILILSNYFLQYWTCFFSLIFFFFFCSRALPAISSLLLFYVKQLIFTLIFFFIVVVNYERSLNFLQIYKY